MACFLHEATEEKLEGLAKVAPPGGKKRKEVREREKGRKRGKRRERRRKEMKLSWSPRFYNSIKKEKKILCKT